MFSFRKRKPQFDLAFHSDEIGYGTHGYLVAQCKQRGIHKAARVRFVFKGMSAPPPLTEQVLACLFNEARNQGFAVQSLSSYGLVIKSEQPSNMHLVLSETRKLSENGNYKRSEQYEELSIHPEGASNVRSFAAVAEEK